MKKKAVVILLLLSTLSFAFGEKTILHINPGTWLVGGGMYASVNGSFEENSRLNFQGSITTLSGFFITPNTMVGVHLDISFGNNKITSLPHEFGILVNSVGLQGRFLFSHTEPVNFYFGVDIAFSIAILLGGNLSIEDMFTGEHMLFGSPIGIYIPLNSAVALDIYIQPTFYVPLGNTGAMGMGIPIVIGFAMFI